MSKQSAINESAIASTDDIATLLDFQQRLLSLVHSQLYSHQIVDDDIIVKFQVNYVTEMNESWKRMVEDLCFRLVKQKIPYQSTLRDHFHKALSVDFLPFLRINKHQLTQVSLYGFDIYVEPLSAILQIINRIDGQIHILNKQLATNPQQLPWFDKPRDIWESVKKGWNQFIYQSSLCKISLNIYILNEYLKIAAKSLVKKDKQIIFTGCCNLFNEIVPILKRNKQIWLLCEFSDLNNELYQFHPSFTYSHFYSLILPLRNQYEPIFRATKYISQKCLSANILTPLLFAVLRHRESFHQFIDQTDDKSWAPYLNGIVFGLIYNFKARILQYDEAMEILKSAILKLGVFGALQTSYFIGELGKQWSEARDFFISALKVGYNVGELQTWHPIDFPTIQQRIINYSKNSLLTHPELPANVPIKLFFPNGFEKQLQNCLQQLTGSLLSKQQLTTNFSPNIAEAVAINENSIYSLLRLSLLINECKFSTNIHCLCYMLSFLNKVQGIQSQILIQRLAQLGDNQCSIAIKELEKQQKNRQDLKEVLFAYIKRNKPVAKIDEIIRVCLMISTPKGATLEILSILQNSEADENLCKIAAANILSVFSPERLDGDVKVKTFEKQYSIQNQIINTNSKLHSCLNILVESIIERDSLRAIQTLMWVSRMSSWIVIPLLSLPVSSRYDRNEPNKKLQSFGMWLIGNPRFHGLLLELLSLGFNQPNRQIKTYFMQICLIGICDQIIMEINRVLNQLAQMQDNQRYKYILQLLQLLTLIYRQSTGTPNLQLIQKIVRLYLRALQKIDVIISNNQDENTTKQIIISIKQLYCPLIDQIFTANNINSRKWRTCMRKLCLTSLDINVEHVSNVRDFQLPTIRKDKGFLINNSVEQNKDIDTYVSTDRLKKRAETLYSEAHKYKYVSAFEPKQRPQQKPQYLLQAAQIKGLKLGEMGDIFYSKQYLLPSFSLRTIKQLLTHCKQVDLPLLVELLAMTPSNHRKLTEWALLNKNRQIINRIGITKQTVSSLLSQILILMENQQKSSLTSSLDEGAKKTISDNLNLMLMRQQVQGKDGNKDKQMISDLSKELGFLLVFNQSNWRYANELINQLASSKMNSFASTPSLLLQYLEYIRITTNSNQDYETKVQAYLDVLLSYESLLKQKHEYLQQLQGQSGLDKGNKDEVMSEQQIRLFAVNQLGYISTICESWCLKDFLYRAAYLRTEVTQLTTEVAKFQPIFKLIDGVVGCLASINTIVNSIARGHVMSPDFINSYRMCSSNAFTKYNIQLGEHLQGYYRNVGQLTPQIYKYIPEGPAAQVRQYLQAALQATANVKGVPDNVRVEIKNRNEHNTKKIISQKYQMLHKYLLDRKIIAISADKQCIQIVRDEQADQQDTKQDDGVFKYLFYYGLLHKAMDLTGQKKLKLDKLVDGLKQRQVLPWQMIKDYDAEAYHHIKSVLIDEQIQSRKLKFVFVEKALVPQGPNIEVNKLNRQRYCNLIGKTSLGLGVLEKGSAVVQGYHSMH